MVVWIVLLFVLLLVAILYIYLQQKEIERKAKEMFDIWIQNYKTSLEESIRKEMQIEFEKWKLKEEERIRKEAVRGSKNVITGQITEQLAPYLPDFPYNPKDARFIGNPIDYVIFDGLSDGEVKQIVLVEVKSGKSGLNKNERMIRDTLEEKNVKFEIYRINNIKKEDVTDEN